ncbi:hypothetical protein OIDMADRAFT_141056 [Oidiodendron maius Zn]|uniref:Copper acquisition factor BIM1-like domain-containing protein n=1 Tax=Oidiodendron maius (strain Zn) TaxID=913774 RepID=A0A0C3HKJ2_OIDMZ|nr:hypothetical protein OIDMADRAFT_141056 [Oidiodendron maius Zn]
MRSSTSLAIASLLTIASAHVQLWYPEWRGNSFLPPFSQTIFPCAGINDNSTTARTLWPLDGGSLNFTLHDDAAYISVNIGLGVNTTNFNITLFSAPLNETGRGNVCFPKLQLPADFVVAEGTSASIQIATTSNSGEGLYNCGDITFTKNATLLPADQCQNSSTITITPLGQSVSTSPSTTSSAPATSSSSAASSLAYKEYTASGFVLLLAGLFTAML